MKTKINGLISRWNIHLAPDGERIAIYSRPSAAILEEIVSLKPQIMAELRQRKATEEELEAAEEVACRARQAKIAAIEGLKAIENAIAAEEAYAEAFDRMMDDEYNDGVNPPSRPKESSKELKAKYPRAAAYIKAENWSFASNYAKAGAGSKAKERIINGEDYNTVLADMDAEWSVHCQEHIWD